MTTTLATMLAGSPYQGYAYAYPHKTAYRPLQRPRPLEEVWAAEDRSSLFLYLHVPFCEMRCGFCNLFTMAKPDQGLSSRFLEALGRQALQARQALGEEARFVRLVFGGGTPTQLDEPGLEALFGLAREVMGADPQAVPVGCEVSPETLTEGKVALLRQHGVDRVSIGVQSFTYEETKAVRRPQDPAQLRRALGWLAGAGFPVFNIDLIYGMPGQTPSSWRASLEEALRYEPQELYLYPLYVRPLTGLGNSSKQWDDQRLELYRLGRRVLLERGWRQVSMRMFRSPDAPDLEGPAYRCQADGMVGLGPGARSYTRALHYSSDYAVGRRSVVSIVEDWVERPGAHFAQVDHGFVLDADEQRRRHLILSLLSEEGLGFAPYQERFGAPAHQHFPQLRELEDLALAARDEDALRLTPAGLEVSDVIGPWLTSPAVEALMEEYELR